MKNFTLSLLLHAFMLHGSLFSLVNSNVHRHVFLMKEVPYKRLCSSKRILTVNGEFPGPTLYLYKGDTLEVNVINNATKNITIHWHGVKQPRNPWSDGPAYITQCPIMPGHSFTYVVKFTMEEGTLWWHAHNDFYRATVHGAIVIYPKSTCPYPFPKPYKEHVVIFGEWWKEDVDVVLERALSTGGNFNNSDAYTINGQPGDLYNCSSPETLKILVEYGKTYLLRMINAAMSTGLFISVANHNLTLVGSDASYTSPLTRDHIVIFPGETMDFLLEANQSPEKRYYVAARALEFLNVTQIDNTTTTAIIEYTSTSERSLPILPQLPYYNDSSAAIDFTFSIRSLVDTNHEISVPKEIDHHIIMAVSVNELPCGQKACEGPNGTRLSSSINNISFSNPSVDILQSYYKRNREVLGTRLPDKPPFFNFTEEKPSVSPFTTRGTDVLFLEWGQRIEIVFQGTSLVLGESHPMHLHGHSFYVVGWGLGNFDSKKDPLRYNLKNPPYKNTIGIPRNGWTAIQFTANNPGVWFSHCHLERHTIWGMDTVFVIKNGPSPHAQILPPPDNMPPCVANMMVASKRDESLVN